VGVVEFVATNLRSVEDLDLLVAMAAGGDRWWDAARTSRELGISRVAARSALERLAARNLLEIRVTDDVRYQLRPGTAALRAAVRACLRAYDADPGAVRRAARCSV
jgi:hypothetical protein